MPPPMCFCCGQPAGYQCDYPLPPGGLSRTCNRPLCAEHCVRQRDGSMSAIYCPEHANGMAVTDWGLLKKRVVDETARLSAAGATDGRADALEECLQLAAEARHAFSGGADRSLCLWALPE